MTVTVETLGVERTPEFLGPILDSFGVRPNPDRLESWNHIDEVRQRLAVLDSGRIVGAAGAFYFDTTVPGGFASTAGLTTVAVRPTHRRRGLMRALVERHLHDARADGRILSTLWASESRIYGRFGYGQGSYACSARIRTDDTEFIAPLADPGQARLVEADEALRVIPGIWERMRPEIPGMLSRSDNWWRLRRLHDWGDGGPLQRMVMELDGRPQGYALYRLEGKFDDYTMPAFIVTVLEAMAATPEAMRAVWRYLLDIDLVAEIKIQCLPTDHALLNAVIDVRRLGFRIADGPYVRVLDVAAALSARCYAGDGAVVLEVGDELIPENTGTYRVDGATGEVARVATAPDIRLDIAALGAVYLGGMSFARLADAGRLQALTPDAAARADDLFRGPRAPWCPEIF